MAAVVFITGRPGIGKSSVIERLVRTAQKKGLSVAGFATPEIRKDSRTGFAVRDIATGKEGVFAITTTIRGAPRVSKYYVDVAAFESVAIPALSMAADLFIIDEIGKMELFSRRFRTAIESVLQSGRSIVATLGKSFVGQFKKYGQVIEVTPQNRENLHFRILELLGLG